MISFIKSKDAQVMGSYKQTDLDIHKSQCDFLLKEVGNKNKIVWKDGRIEWLSDSKLSKLQQNHVWSTDF